jgi:hypothetical protein
MKLRFRGQQHDFAVPLRSNISPNTPKDQYFALPPRPTTKSKHRHGIHYLKMFPVTKEYQRRFRTEGNPYYETVQKLVDSNTSRIVSECQIYLDDYEKSGKPLCATDLDYLLKTLKQGETNNQKPQGQSS